MSRVRERAKQQMPTVLLTLVSILQALALEVHWSTLGEREHLWQGGAPAAVGWLQIAGGLLVILLVWYYYAQLIMRFVWLPGLRDSVAPFIFGIGEFTLAALIEPGKLHLWLYVGAGLFAFSYLSNRWTFEAARREPENAAFFASKQPSPLEAYGPTAFAVGLLVLMGVLVQAIGDDGALGVTAMLLTVVMLAAQILLIRVYWKRSMEI